MKTSHHFRSKGFTLAETIIAIGVVAVLLTTFLVVFGPAAQGIKKAINIQVADSLSSALERDLVLQENLGNLEEQNPYKKENFPTGFDKAFDAIRNSNVADTAWIVYQYRAQAPNAGTGQQDAYTESGVAGEDYIVKAVARRQNDPRVAEELDAVEGPVYFVKMKQLVFSGSGGLVVGSPGSIRDPKPSNTPGNPPTSITAPNDYPEAVIAFVAEYFPLRSSRIVGTAQFAEAFANAGTPAFSRNLAVRR